MSVVTAQIQVQYVSTGGAPNTQVIAIPFPFYDVTHLQVMQTNLDGSQALMVYGPLFIGTWIANVHDQTVTLTGLTIAGTIITIRRVVPLTQLATYVPNDAFPAKTHEMALDLAIMAIQQLQDEISRCVQVPGSILDGGVGSAAARANKLLGFDNAGNLVLIIPA
jgi:hypothetical protein